MRPRDVRFRKKKRLETLILIAGGLFGIFLIGLFLYQVPGIKKHLDWRIETARTFLHSLVQPIGALPTAGVTAPTQIHTITPTKTDVPVTPQPAAVITTPVAVTSTTTPLHTLTPSITATQIMPAQWALEAPPFEGQDWNNCGPVSLSMYLHYYGWEGDQYAIAELIKPLRADRNVNIDELEGYVFQNIWWLKAVYRVGGDVDLIRRLIFSGFPVLVEESMRLEKQFWFNDDLWAGHYLLITAYDDVRKLFTTQDSFVGPNHSVSYSDLERNWQAFNFVYLVIYPPEDESAIQTLLGDNWEPVQNRKHALQLGQEATQRDPQNAFAWFNLGSNLVYFERYAEAAAAFDQARQLNLPQRMLRYQFGPFLAYFNINRNEDLVALADYALSVTPNSEEAFLWKGWALYKLNRKAAALENIKQAVENRPGYADALYALDYMQAN